MPSLLIAQKTKRQLTEAEYNLWSTMNVEQLSEAGNWVSYSLHYENGNDTLFVKNTRNLKTFWVSGGYDGKFAKETFFICQNNERQLLVRNLTRHHTEVIKDINSFAITADGKQLVAYRTTEKGEELIIKSFEGKKDTIISGVGLYSYNTEANSIVYSVKNELMVLNLNSNMTTTILKASETSRFSDFVWQKNGESIAYLFTNSTVKLGLYRIESQENFVFDQDLFSSFPKDDIIYNSSFTALTISEDGTQVFFGLKPDDKTEESTGVQLWNTADKSLYPEKRNLNGFTALPKMAVWSISDNSFQMITNNELPHLMLTGDQKHVLLWNPIGNEPQPERDAPVDFYLSNINTGETELFLSKQSADYNKLSVSGTGRFIAYYRDRDWWIYDVVSHEHQNLTSLIGQTFADENYNRSGEKKAAGIAGWTSDDSAMLIYDTYDVWLVKTDGSGYKQLTDGRSSNMIYRIVPQFMENRSVTNFSWNQKGTYNLADGLLLNAIGDSKSGYYKWTPGGGLQPFFTSSNRVGTVKISKTNAVCVFTEEHYHQPPRIMMQIKNRSAKVLYESNQQQKKYHWGFSKLITFENSKGETLKGALFYPAGYTPEKSYAMVVHIYESQAAQYNKYVNPTLYNYDGFNISNFTSQDYFVLLPDIKKEEGNPGMSAVDCVSAAVKEVLAHEPINPKQIGLLGHSFGGYETNFIITQSNMFSAAISGSGISNIVSDYLYVSGNTLKSNGWRYEFDQASIGVSLFDDYDAYIKNSPITFAKQIQTPLLLWAGDHDKTVSPSQSVELHLALRRLQKTNVMLLYEGDSHSLGNKKHQQDLTVRMKEWFDFYLKFGPKPYWLTADKF